MVAQAYDVSRRKQDEYALMSHTRAAKVKNSASFVLALVDIGACA
jgi:acetyl-CoA acyltransferase 1